MQQLVTRTVYNGPLFRPFRLCQFDRYLKSRAMEFHSHDCYQLVLVLKETFGFEFMEGNIEKMDIKRGEAGVVPPGILHIWNASRSNCETLTIMSDALSPQNYGDLSRVFGGTTRHPFKASINLAQAAPIIAELKTEFLRLRPGRAALVHSYLVALIALVVRDVIEKHTLQPGDHEGQLVQQALNYMEENYGKQIALSDIATQVSLSMSRFSEIFHSHTGMAPMQYLHNIRLARAKLFLSYSNLTISEIALQTGFKSLQYFSRVIRKKEGLSPFKMRQKLSSGPY